MSSCFSWIATDFQVTLHLALGLVGMHLTAASIWLVIKFLHSLFRVCLSDVSGRVSNLFFTVTAN